MQQSLLAKYMTKWSKASRSVEW